MPEWTITIDSPEDSTSDDNVLDEFLSELERDPRAMAPAASMNIEKGQIGATFTVVADTRDGAALEGCLAFWRATAAAGVELTDLSSVVVSPVENDLDITEFRGAVTLEHAA